MRVIHASYSRGNVRGGERQLVLLVERLRGLGFEQTVLCRRNSGLRDALTGMRNVRILNARSHILDPIRPVSADILHAHEGRAAYWAALAGRTAGIPYIITRRIVDPVSENPLTRSIYLKAAAVVGVSEAACRALGEQIGRGTVCVHDAHQSLSIDRTAVARVRDMIGGDPIIGQVAALVDSRKGQSASIKAFARIRRRFPNARLALIGEGPDEPMLRNLAAEIGGVIFVGYQEEIGIWTAALDLVLHPSTKDALASSLLDAMHLGVPIVANRVGGIPEIARHEQSALLVEFGDVEGLAEAAIRVLEDPTIRHRIVAGGRAVASSHDAAAMAEAYASVYRLARR